MSQADLEKDTLARTLWGEARGEGVAGMEAVASAILNRVKIAQAQHNKKFWWGNTISTVCRKEWQFSCWNKNDPNCALLQTVGPSDTHFAQALEIAGRACEGKLPDSTNGATHYHHKSINPYWTASETPTAKIGHHIFYRLI